MMEIGILALQGAVREHGQALRQLGAAVHEVRRPAELSGLDGLVLPGGESTAMRRLLDRAELLDPLRQFCRCRPVLATCAGAILLANAIEDSEQVHLGVLDATIRRNGFGGQLDSFRVTAEVAGVGPFPLVFIRAPYFTRLGPGVQALARVDGRVVGVRQGRLLALSFHPELTTDLRLHQLWLRGVAEASHPDACC